MTEGLGPRITAGSSIALTVWQGTLTTYAVESITVEREAMRVTPPSQDHTAELGLNPSLPPESLLLTTESSHPCLSSVPNPLPSPGHTDHSGCKRTPVSSKTSV